jgi:hypothetical protein
VSREKRYGWQDWKRDFGDLSDEGMLVCSAGTFEGGLRTRRVVRLDGGWRMRLVTGSNFLWSSLKKHDANAGLATNQGDNRVVASKGGGRPSKLNQAAAQQTLRYAWNGWCRRANAFECSPVQMIL